MLLFIGSTVADVILRVPALPASGDDLNLQGQDICLGGCAYNAFTAARLMGAQATLFSPVGSGVWGDWVRQALAQHGVASAIEPVDAPNGCCYCLVEPGGERTFLCDHGAEYRFRPEWFRALDAVSFSGVYLCGLEVEEATGDVLLDWLENHPPRRLYFAPGPRICHIPPRKMARVMALHPLMHLSEREAVQFTRQDEPELAAALIHRVSGGDVVVTLGERGAYLRTSAGGETIPARPVPVCDAIGAGDAHIGAIMAGEDAGLPLAEAVARANRLSAAVVSHPGATLSASAWHAWASEHPIEYKE